MAARSHVVRDPPRIETCASAPRLWSDLGIRDPLWSPRQARSASTRGFGTCAPSSSAAFDCDRGGRVTPPPGRQERLRAQHGNRDAGRSRAVGKQRYRGCQAGWYAAIVVIRRRLPVVEVQGPLRPEDALAEEGTHHGQEVVLPDGDVLRVLGVPGLILVVLRIRGAGVVDGLL